MADELETLIRLTAQNAASAVLRQVKGEMQGLQTGVAQFTAVTGQQMVPTMEQRVPRAAAASRRGLGQMRNALTALAFSATGASPQLARLSAALLLFGAGSGVTLGVMAGLAVIAGAVRLLGGEAAKSKKLVDDFLKGLKEAERKKDVPALALARTLETRRLAAHVPVFIGAGPGPGAVPAATFAAQAEKAAKKAAEDRKRVLDEIAATAVKEAGASMQRAEAERSHKRTLEEVLALRRAEAERLRPISSLAELAARGDRQRVDAQARLKAELLDVERRQKSIQDLLAKGVTNEDFRRLHTQELTNLLTEEMQLRKEIRDIQLETVASQMEQVAQQQKLDEFLRTLQAFRVPSEFEEFFKAIRETPEQRSIREFKPLRESAVGLADPGSIARQVFGERQFPGLGLSVEIQDALKEQIDLERDRLHLIDALKAALKSGNLTAEEAVAAQELLADATSKSARAAQVAAAQMIQAAASMIAGITNAARSGSPGGFLTAIGGALGFIPGLQIPGAALAGAGIIMGALERRDEVKVSDPRQAMILAKIQSMLEAQNRMMEVQPETQIILEFQDPTNPGVVRRIVAAANRVHSRDGTPAVSVPLSVVGID